MSKWNYAGKLVKIYPFKTKIIVGLQWYKEVAHFMD